MRIETMQDEEILEAMLEAFEEDGRLSMNYIDIEVVDGSITLSGRVSSQEELEVIDEVLEDLDIEDYKNKVWVDETLNFEDSDDESPNLKGMNFDDDEIDDQEYSDDDDEEEEII
ncbi:MAG: BON domain-containing protein [Deltaproteobacteria bacterium]|nr:BON domain-containing protein [Deltaproteobacteria bacterium]